MFLFVLLAMEVDAVTQEGCCKRNAIGTLASGGDKVVLTLLAEVIAFHVGLTTIDVRWSSLQWLFTGAVRGGSSSFKDRPEDSLQIFFFILSNRRFSRGIDWALIMARLRRGWRPQWTFGGAFLARAFTALGRSHPGSRGGAEQSGVNPKQRYLNGLADPLGMEQLELWKSEAHIRGHILSLWDAQRDWIVLLKWKKVGEER